MTAVIRNIELLDLDNLDDDWAETVYASEYQDYDEIPDNYGGILENMSIRSVLECILGSVSSWLTTECDEDEVKSWDIIARRIPYLKLSTILGYLIRKGSRNVTIEDLRTTALLSARVYFKLLSIPRSRAQDKEIFHCQLFANSLDCVGFPKMICDLYDESKNKGQKSLEEIRSIQDLRNHVNTVIVELQLFVNDLRAIVENLPLDPNDAFFEEVLDKLLEVTGGAIVNKLNVDRIEFAHFTKVVYEVIHILVCDGEDPNERAVHLLLKSLRSKLVAVCMDSRASNSIVRASYVAYSGVVLSTYGMTALASFHILLQHLCYTIDGLERAEARTTRVQMVAGLMSFLPGKIHDEFLRWVIVLSKSGKGLHRHLAVDILEKLLSYDDSAVPTGSTDGLNAAEGNQQENGEAVSLDKGQETNSMEIVETDQVTPTTTEGLAAAVENAEPQVTEEELRRILQERTITVPYGEILRAMYERVHDTSSTVRTRAVAVLTKCLDNERPAMKQALKEMQGEGDVTRLMAVAARAVCDERASVRRAAVFLVQRLLEMQEANPSTIDLGILSGLCRDANVTVRTAAITGLTDLVTNRPTALVFDAYLTGPMRQLKDPEEKVAELTRTMVRGLLIDRLRRYTTGYEDPIPWLMLAAIIRHNMRSNLQVACALLAKTTDCISVWLVDGLSTHLGACGAARDLQVLVLLTSVARDVHYSDIGFVLDYYYRLHDAGQCLYPDEQPEPRLMPLTLELLTEWSRYATAEQRAALHTQLVHRLAASTDDGCRIAGAYLARQLDLSDLTWATELMQMAERFALNGGAVDEWMRAADLSLVSPVPPSPALMQLFLNAISRPPAGWTERQAGECVAGAGRLCVRSRAMAAAAAPTLADLLHARTAALPARINALLVLSDICTRYSNIVEPVLEDVCGCLDSRAPPELRRHAARAITRLLLAGYLRLRPPLYFKYCALLADEDHDVREPAEYYVTCSLTTETIYHHFVDCLKNFNSSENGDSIAFDARQLIYDVMLQRLTLVQKLNAQCRLAKDVLEHAADIVDEGEELQESMNNMLLDTITVLCGPRMRLPKQPSTSGEVDIDDIQERVTTNIVSHKMKHTVAEVLIPAVLRLHARLRAGGGQLLAYLVRLATDLLTDYRQEIEEFIEDDEELVEQIQQFQDTIGLERTNGNARNLVTSSGPPEPDTPRAPRRRAGARAGREPPRKRALNI